MTLRSTSIVGHQKFRHRACLIPAPFLTYAMTSMHAEQHYDMPSRPSDGAMIDSLAKETTATEFSSASSTCLSLLLAMAPIDSVLNAVEDPCGHSNDQETDNDRDLQVQEELASALDHAWNDHYGPSKTYLKAVCKTFITRVGEDRVQSETLLALLIEMLSHCASHMPDPNEHCYLTFPLPSTDSPLMIRIYPQHNDLSLRLWEAGATLAEYLYANPHLVEDQHVIELGAGVGLTGLLCLACEARLVTCTDYTERALENLRHNYAIQTHNVFINSDKCQFEALHLDWAEAANGNGDHVGFPGLEALLRSNLLLAVDVIYDRSVIPCLVRLIQLFLESQDCSPSTLKTVLFAATLRNASSLELFETELAHCGIAMTLVASGQDCENLPKLFPTKFVQPRTDVRIFTLQCIG